MLFVIISILTISHVVLLLKLQEAYKEMKNKRVYRCTFKMSLFFDNQELELENKHPIFLPVMPFIGLRITDCLNPIDPNQSAEDHDFKEFRSGVIEQITWNNFAKLYECQVASINITEHHEWDSIQKELDELGWKVSPLSALVQKIKSRSKEVKAA